VPAEPVPSDAAERLRLRYPKSRLPRPVLGAASGLLALVFLAWVIWTASAHASPAVSGTVSSYHVTSDSEVSMTVTVQRPDPGKPAVCRVIAQAADFQLVGAADLYVPSRSEEVVNVTVQLKTLRRATSASVKSCSLA